VRSKSSPVIRRAKSSPAGFAAARVALWAGTVDAASIVASASQTMRMVPQPSPAGASFFSEHPPAATAADARI